MIFSGRRTLPSDTLSLSVSLRFPGLSSPSAASCLSLRALSRSFALHPINKHSPSLVFCLLQGLQSHWSTFIWNEPRRNCTHLPWEVRVQTLLPQASKVMGLQLLHILPTCFLLFILKCLFDSLWEPQRCFSWGSSPLPTVSVISWAFGYGSVWWGFQIYQTCECAKYSTLRSPLRAYFQHFCLSLKMFKPFFFAFWLFSR